MSIAPEQVQRIGITRHFTTPDVHPYDTVEWERRDARIPDHKTGGDAFHQPDVEFPVAWSQNATNIVAQKYFRGPLGAPEREWSLRQIIDRVADTIASWGVRDGYFVDEDESEAFRAELKYVLLHQRAAFNSPVWFNIGVAGEPQQASACQPYHAEVLTPEGSIPIGRLVETYAVGAKVLDAHGLTKVVAVKHNGRKPVLRIHTKAGYVLDVTGDHLVWRAADDRYGAWVPAGDLRPGDALAWHRTEQWGEGEITALALHEAALAGWLQSDGFVGQYEGTNRSLTIEAMTVTDAEYHWVLDSIDRVFPDVHRHERAVPTQDELLDCRRIRLYGQGLEDFVERWGLRARGTDMVVPAALFTAPLPVVAMYLQSLFQAEGYVSVRERGAMVGLDMISEDLVRGVQRLLARFGIYARVRFKADPRSDRQGCWSLAIRPLPDRIRFAEAIGFVDPRKTERLEVSLEMHGIADRPSKRLQIDRVEQLGVMDVYDIQTESGEYLTSGGLRVHNCFILDVDDTMDSILNWYREEGTIFKGGSGSGVNLSKIRSSKEALKGGGTASGPVSFMRGADSSAGTIKSGGKTRRAAKMVILNADHPDVEEFVWCKALEERKARALRDAGFDVDLDGRDSHSLQYQNANNSVRVTDAFMQAVVDDADWELRAVTSGEPVQTVKARALFRQIAEAAWECADPGMQFDSTINRWHTSANTGRINASNPCSEYMHLDNSACNLASINLLKYLGDDGSFDVEGFKATVDVIFTAQEILVGNADYPTEKIAETSRAFRQLGIGYANLGALLMARGLPYDSDEGRAWAGAITSLMTGHAYATSARTAARMGPFAGHAVNREPMQRVLEQHRAAAADIDEELVAPDLLDAARHAWDEACDLGAEYGVRNSQASVLAPTGTIGLMMDCDTTGVEPDLALTKTKKLVGGGTMQIVNRTVPRALRTLGYTDEQVDAVVTYIDDNKSIIGAPDLAAEHLPVFATAMGDNVIHYMGHVRMMAAAQPFLSGAISKCVVGETLLTTEDGLVRIGSLSDGEAPDSFREHVMEVASLHGVFKTDAFYYGGVRPVREVTLRSGHRVVGTPNHRLLVAGSRGLDWRRLDEIGEGDHVATRYGADMWSPMPTRISGFTPSARYGPQKAVTVPEWMTMELAFLLGAYVAEGHTTASNWTVTITNADDAVIERVAAAWRSQFRVEPRIVRRPDRCPQVLVASKTIVEFLDHLGCGRRASEKRIPDAVLRSPREMVLAFLQGLALDAYTATMGTTPKWAICVDSPALLDDLQAVLTNLGIVHSRISKHNSEYDKDFDEVFACGRYAQALIRLVPFVETHKRARGEALLALRPAQSTADVVPGITPRELLALVPHRERNDAGVLRRTEFGFLADDRTLHVSRRTLERVAAIPGVELPEWLRTVVDDNLHFSPVSRVEDAGEREVFDVSVPITHAFVGNGVVNHNTINMPEEATVEEVEHLHVEAWKLGLKAIAIYRDNCKVAQPLATQKKAGAPADPAAAPAGAPQASEGAAPERIVETIIVQEPVRQRLPKRRTSKTFSFRVADCKGYVTVGEFEDGRPGEIFLKVAKQGSTLAGIMDAFAISVSHGLQYGVPLKAFVEMFTNMRFEPAGMTDDKDIRFASSLVDYIFRRLAVEYIPYDERAEMGIFTVEERTQPTLPGVEEATTPTSQAGEADPDLGHPELDFQPRDDTGEVPVVDIPIEPSAAERAAPPPAAPQARHIDAPMCFSCGAQMQPSGSCYVCTGCGSTSGCS